MPAPGPWPCSKPSTSSSRYDSPLQVATHSALLPHRMPPGQQVESVRLGKGLDSVIRPGLILESKRAWQVTVRQQLSP